MDEQIMQALEKIQQICGDSSCDVCPFSVGDSDCAFDEVHPNAWNINKPDGPFHYFR